MVKTLSLCTTCYKKIPASIQIIGGEVIMTKTCDVHGQQSAVVEKDPVHFSNHYKYGTLGNNNTIIIHAHDQCNMQCSWCYYRMGCEKVYGAGYYDSLLRHNYGSYNLLLSGGEPTIRPDYFDFVKQLSDLGWNVASITNMIKLADPEFYEQCQTPEFMHGGILRFAMSMQHPKNYSSEIYEKKISTIRNMEEHDQKAMCMMFSITSLDELDWIKEFYMNSRKTYKMLRIRTMFRNWANKDEESEKIFLSELHKAFLEKFADLNPVASMRVEQSNMYCLYMKMDDDMDVSLSSAPDVGNLDYNMCSRPVHMLARDGRCYPVPIAQIVNEGFEKGWYAGLPLDIGGQSCG